MCGSIHDTFNQYKQQVFWQTLASEELQESRSTAEALVARTLAKRALAQFTSNLFAFRTLSDMRY